MSISPTKRSGGGLIRRLDQHVIAKIAAGEVIGRPYNVIKEMLENSIDAHATNVQIIVKDGGLKSISIADNGDGISKEDMSMICERFATSKLSVYDDLRCIGTFGFRGEALSSISQISHVTVTTMQKGALHGYTAHFKDGKMIAKDRGASAEPRPCAGTQGTQFLVEDLFYNYPLRKTSMSPLDEYAKIYDVVVRYALHFSGVALNLKKLGENKADVSTKRTNTLKDNIRELFGSAISRDLIPLELTVGGYGANAQNASSSASASSSVESIAKAPKSVLNSISSTKSPLLGTGSSHDKSGPIQFKISGFVSGPTAATKKNIFVLFINDRLVNCAQLKRVLESQYTLVTAKASVFIYLSLHIDPARVDVNMHPNKQEVGLEDQAAIIQQISEYFISEIEKVNSQQDFQDNTTPERTSDLAAVARPYNPNQYASTSSIAATIVRTDAREGSMDRYLGPRRAVSVSEFGSSTEEEGSTPTLNKGGNRAQGKLMDLSVGEESEGREGVERARDSNSKSSGASSSGLISVKRELMPLDARELDEGGDSEMNSKKRPRSSFEGDKQQAVERSLVARTPSKPAERQGRLLTSVAQLIHECELSASPVIANVLKDAVIIGSLSSRKLLIQSGTTMYLLDMPALSRELLYQECLHRFGEMSVFELEEPASIGELVTLAVDAEMELRPRPTQEAGLIAAAAQQLLTQNRQLFAQYFGIMISENGTLLALPEIIEGYMPPNLDGLPLFFYNLYSKISFADEKDTFDKIARELAALYAIPSDEDPEDLKGVAGGPPELVSSGVAWAIEHQILPAIKRRFSPPPVLHQMHSIVSVVSTTKLFKIFERC